MKSNELKFLEAKLAHAVAKKDKVLVAYMRERIDAYYLRLERRW